MLTNRVGSRNGHRAATFVRNASDRRARRRARRAGRGRARTRRGGVAVGVPRPGRRRARPNPVRDGGRRRRDDRGRLRGRERRHARTVHTRGPGRAVGRERAARRAAGHHAFRGATGSCRARARLQRHDFGARAGERDCGRHRDVRRDRRLAGAAAALRGPVECSLRGRGRRRVRAAVRRAHGARRDAAEFRRRRHPQSGRGHAGARRAGGRHRPRALERDRGSRRDAGRQHVLRRMHRALPADATIDLALGTDCQHVAQERWPSTRRRCPTATTRYGSS